MKGKAFLKKAIPLAIVFLFVVVAFSPIYANSTGTSSAHEHSVNNNPQANLPSSNSPSSSASPSGSFTNGGSRWAFDGKYLNYTLALTTRTGNISENMSGYIDMEITGVNTNNKTITVLENECMKEDQGSSYRVYVNTTFWMPWYNPSFEYNTDDLSMLKDGNTPVMNENIFSVPSSDSSSTLPLPSIGLGATVFPDIPLRTGMGTFLTYRINVAISSQEFTAKAAFYVDQDSGVILEMQEIESMSDHSNLSSNYTMNFTIQLQSTNINLSNHLSTLKINVLPHDASIAVYRIYSPVTPGSTSVLLNGYSAQVNSTGYYNISLPAGTYIISVTHTGYYPSTRIVTPSGNITYENFTLAKEPAYTSSNTTSNINATGYNVTISQIMLGSGNISINYTATSNGTITVVLPYSLVKNATINNLASSKVYIDGTQYDNFTVAISSSGTVILTVQNLAGDPTLVWQYSPTVSSPSPAPKLSPVSSAISDIEIYIIIGVIAIVAIAGVALVMKRKK